MPCSPQRGTIIFRSIARRVAPGAGTQRAPTSRGLGAWPPLLPAACCAHTPFPRCLLRGARRPGQGAGREIPALRLPGVAPHPASVGTHRLAPVVCWKNTDSREN